MRCSDSAVSANERHQGLIAHQRLKMARSANAYVRGSTKSFYEWLEKSNGQAVPDGPPIWICGDCHVGNLGPVADSNGKIAIHMRDFDQTVIGNPAHDLIRLGLSLSMSARGSDLPGVTTALILEHMTDGYMAAFGHEGSGKDISAPEPVFAVLRKAFQRRWKNLAEERFKDIRPEIPLGKRFWPLSKEERGAIESLAETETLRGLVTHLTTRRDKAKIELLDAAYWVKGCSSLGRLRYAVLLRMKGAAQESALSLIDIKEAVHAVAPRADHRPGGMPANSADRVVMGARVLAPALGNRMIAAKLLGKPVIIRELLPQDLKLEIEQLTRRQACKAARFLGNVVGRAHAGQLYAEQRLEWAKTLEMQRSASLKAPWWLWTSIVDLVGIHEKAYLDHCRRFALADFSAGLKNTPPNR